MRLVDEARNYTDEFLIGDALHDMDRGADFAGGGCNCYSWHYSLGYQLRPRVVVEIGTRFGYSMLSMFRSQKSRERLEIVHCFDNESCVPGSILHASRHFAANSIPHRITVANTQDMNSLPVNGADVCHVDADHSECGCFHDCMIAWEALVDGGHLIVDDAKYFSVASGVARFLLMTGRTAEFHPSLRGFYLISK